MYSKRRRAAKKSSSQNNLPPSSSSPGLTDTDDSMYEQNCIQDTENDTDDEKMLRRISLLMVHGTSLVLCRTGKALRPCPARLGYRYIFNVTFIRVIQSNIIKSREMNFVQSAEHR
jgi:hypothetical protein